MAIVKELIRKEADDSLSFGNYESPEKQKVSDFEYQGGRYKVKTYKDITKLEKDGIFVYESTPGTAVNAFRETEDAVAFFVEGIGDTQITLGVESDAQYQITVEGEDLGVIKTNFGGKLTVALEMEPGSVKEVSVKKC